MRVVHTKDGRILYKDDKGHWLKKGSDVREPEKEQQIAKYQQQAEVLNNPDMAIPYDQWTPDPRGQWEARNQSKEEHYDAEDPYVTYEYDETRYVKAPDVRKTTKKSTLAEVEAWKDDEGYYGDSSGDQSILIFYEDGRMLDLTDGEKHKKWSKQGIIGISVNTADYEQVWGYELHKGELVPLETHEFDEHDNLVPGYTNSYSGEQITGKYKVRVRETTYLDKKWGRWRTKYDTLKKSTVKSI